MKTLYYRRKGINGTVVRIKDDGSLAAMAIHSIVLGKLKDKFLNPDGTTNWELVRDFLARNEEHFQIVESGPPSVDKLTDMSIDGVARATDGCHVEPDGTCEHGHDSWLKVLGFV